MDAVARGIILNRERARQIRDFSGMLYGSITPTDIDGLIEYRNKCYVLFEEKYRDAKLPRGQELALERICDDLQKVKPALLIVANHEAEPGKDIDVASSFVVKFRFENNWYFVAGKVTTKELTTRFIERYGK
jgi:hypothetical protein